jgi:hypothetical protein
LPERPGVVFCPEQMFVLGVNLWKHEATRSLPSGAEVDNTVSFTSISRTLLHGVVPKLQKELYFYPAISIFVNTGTRNRNSTRIPNISQHSCLLIF